MLSGTVCFSILLCKQVEQVNKTQYGMGDWSEHYDSDDRGFNSMYLDDAINSNTIANNGY